MSSVNAPISSPKNAVAITEAARAFVSAPKFFKVLEQYRLAVLTLRARDASCLQIQDLLKEHQVFVSEPAVYRFCRKYRHEVMRLRLELEQETDDSPHAASIGKAPPSSLPIITTPNSPAPTTRKIRDLRGDV